MVKAFYLTGIPKNGLATFWRESKAVIIPVSHSFGSALWKDGKEKTAHDRDAPIVLFLNP